MQPQEHKPEVHWMALQKLGNDCTDMGKYLTKYALSINWFVH
ncbi:hypothetical protein M527_23585 [Sphingobium indicum IP26]|nr:hypothetical protein M527_23585 [Sphingobium indicum IP26]